MYVVGFALTECLCVECSRMQYVCNSFAYLSISTAMFKHCSPTSISLQERVVFNDLLPSFGNIWESGSWSLLSILYFLDLMFLSTILHSMLSVILTSQSMANWWFMLVVYYPCVYETGYSWNEKPPTFTTNHCCNKKILFIPGESHLYLRSDASMFRCVLAPPNS